MPKPKAPKQIRLLPFTIFMAFMVLTLKIGDVAKDMGLLGINSAHAKEETKTAQKSEGVPLPPAKKEKTAPPEEKPESEKPEVEKKDKSLKHLLELSKEEANLILEMTKAQEKVAAEEKKLESETGAVKALMQRMVEEAKKAEAVTQKSQKNQEADKKREEAANDEAKVFAAMKPDEAAKILETLDLKAAAIILDKISGAKRAHILAVMDKRIVKVLVEQKILPPEDLSSNPSFKPDKGKLQES